MCMAWVELQADRPNAQQSGRNWLHSGLQARVIEEAARSGMITGPQIFLIILKWRIPFSKKWPKCIQWHHISSSYTTNTAKNTKLFNIRSYYICNNRENLPVHILQKCVQKHENKEKLWMRIIFNIWEHLNMYLVMAQC